MAGVGHLHDNRIDHGQVQRRGHAVIQEGGVHQLALIVEVVLLVERPANALHSPALQLALHVARMDGLAYVLYGSVAKNLHLARFGVYLYVDDVQREGVADSARVDGGAANNGPARAV